MHRAKTKLHVQNVMRCNRKRWRESESKIAAWSRKNPVEIRNYDTFRPDRVESTLKYVIRELVICVCVRD